jgi:hypothetical protein
VRSGEGPNGALTPRSVTFRFFGSGGAEWQLTPANGSSPLNPHNVARIPYRTNVGDVSAFTEAVSDDRTWKLRLKLRADSSDRGTDQLRAGEALVQWNPRPWLDVTAGRVIEKWGTAYAWNPTSFVGPVKNPTDPSDRRSSYRGVDMVKADIFVRDTNVSLYALGHGTFAARAYRLIGGTDVSLHVRRDRGGMREGLSIARVFGDALELHGEIARNGSVTQAVIGGQYTLPHNINMVVELYHGGDGLSRGEWLAFRDSVDADLRGANRRYAPLKMARDYSFLRIARSEYELIAITNLRDRSSLLRLTLGHRIRPNLSVYVIQTEFFGASGSEFAYIQVKRATTFGARYYF